jgi:hypothetical protein
MTCPEPSYLLPADRIEVERKAFEDFLVNEEGCADSWLERGKDGEYKTQGLRGGWKAWQARAALHYQTVTG